MDTRWMSGGRPCGRPSRAGRARAVLGAALALGLPVDAAGQTVWTDPVEPPWAWVEMMRPAFADGFGSIDLTTASSAWFAGARYRISATASLVGEVPFSYGEPDDAPFFDAGTTAVGNPYVGVELSRGEPVWFELGLRLPLAPDEENLGAALGLLADPVDRMEAYAIDLVPVTGMVNYQRIARSGFLVRIRTGAVGWFPTGGGDPDVQLAYGGQIGFRNAAVLLLGGVSGRAILTEDAGGIGERTVHHAGIAVGVPLGRLQPAFQLRVPLDDDLRNLQDATWGIAVALR